MRARTALWLVFAIACAGCDGGNDVADAAMDASAPDASRDATAPCRAAAGERLVVTADWLNRSLSLLSYDRLLDRGCGPEDVIVDSIALPDYPPGPLEIEITPDGSTALVAVSPGFFGGMGGALIGSPDVPDGGTLLAVDLVERELAAEIEVEEVPMGMAIHPDGTTAFTTNFGVPGGSGSTVSVVDLETYTVTDTFEVGTSPEQVALSQDGSIGVVNVTGEGGVRVFETDAPEETLSAVAATGDDPSDVDFVDDIVIVANSMSVTWSAVDVGDPAMPVPLGEPTDVLAGAPYGVTRVPGTDSVLVTASLSGASLLVIDAGSEPPTMLQRIALPAGPFPLGAAVTPDGEHAFVAHPEDRTLSVVDLATGDTRALSWLEDPGPTYVAVRP